MYHDGIAFDGNPDAVHTAAMRKLDPSHWIENDSTDPSKLDSVGRFQYQNEYDSDFTAFQNVRTYHTNIDSQSSGGNFSPSGLTRTGTWSGSVGGCKVIYPCSIS
jgi:hypothetical protein